MAAAAAAAVAALFASLLLLAILRNWYPLPHWDMWEGYVGFWYRLADGDGWAWWAQHNEHRLVLGRVFYWIDLAAFSGGGWFLIASNVVSAGLIAVALARAFSWRAQETSGTSPDLPRPIMWLGAAALSAAALSWTQWENFLMGFNIQFFLASLLPLTGFVALSRAANPRELRRYSPHAFWLAAATGLLSPWTNAGGLIVPYLLIVQGWMLRLPRRWLWTLLGIAVGNSAAYLIGYTSRSGSGLLEGLAQHAGEVASFFLIYLGSPVARVADTVAFAFGLPESDGRSAAIHGIGIAAGAVLLVGASGYLLRHLVMRRSSPIGLAMATFITFVVGGSALTAAGRWTFGLDQAMSSRYQTPVLVAWACLLILLTPRLRSSAARRPVFAHLAVLALPFALLPYQLGSLVYPDSDAGRHRQHIATLAIALGVPDMDALSATYFSPYPLQFTPRLREDGLTIIGKEPYRSLASRLGENGGKTNTTVCKGTIVARVAIAGSAFTRVTGSLSSEVALDSNHVLSVFDSNGKRVGYLDLMRSATPNVAAEFTGYVSASAVTRSLTAGGIRATCEDPLD